MNGAVSVNDIDTDVVSMLFKGDTRGFHFRKHIVGRLLGISFMSLVELERWPLERNWGSVRKAELERHLTHYTVLPVNRELCRKWPRYLSTREDRAVTFRRPTLGSRPPPCIIRFP